jgi:hypothetical protein
MKLVLVVVPIQRLSRCTVCLSNAGKFVVFFKYFLKVLCMFFTDVFQAKIINNQCELYWSCVVLPKARYQLVLLVSIVTV